jgi:hypothetical protein
VYWGQLWDGSQVLFLLNYEPQESSFCYVQPFFPLQAAVLDSGAFGIVGRNRTTQWKDLLMLMIVS